jgi:hypothetical protein
MIDGLRIRGVYTLGSHCHAMGLQYSPVWYYQCNHVMSPTDEYSFFPQTSSEQTAEIDSERTHDNRERGLRSAQPNLDPNSVLNIIIHTVSQEKSVGFLKWRAQDFQCGFAWQCESKTAS